MNTITLKRQSKTVWRHIALAVVLGSAVTACYDSDTEQAPPAVPPPAVVTVSNDTLSVPLDTPGNVSVLNNDHTTSGQNLSIDSYSDTSANGATITHNGNGVFTYVPVTSFSGEDTFSYTAMDPDGTKADGMVVITVSADVIPNGQLFYANNCAVCHSAGTEDPSSAFNATDLALSTNQLSSDLTGFGGDYDLMGAYGDIAQVNVDELIAYINSL